MLCGIYISITMKHCVTLEFRRIMDRELQDLITYAAGLELLLEHDIMSSQTAHNCLVFENSRDQLLALVILAAKTGFTAGC